jgi:hypothetical protein
MSKRPWTSQTESSGTRRDCVSTKEIHKQIIFLNRQDKFTFSFLFRYFPITINLLYSFHRVHLGSDKLFDEGCVLFKADNFLSYFSRKKFVFCVSNVFPPPSRISCQSASNLAPPLSRATLQDVDVFQTCRVRKRAD